MHCIFISSFNIFHALLSSLERYHLIHGFKFNAYTTVHVGGARLCLCLSLFRIASFSPTLHRFLPLFPYFCPVYPLILSLSFISLYDFKLLFIERLLYSAEIKYLTAYLLTVAAERNKEKDIVRNQIQDPSVLNGTNTGLFSTYATALKSYSIINAALCRSHRSVKKFKISQERNAPMVDQSTAKSVNEKFIEQNTSLTDQCMYLCGIDAFDLMNSINMNPNSINLRFRSVAILEKLLK